MRRVLQPGFLGLIIIVGIALLASCDKKDDPTLVPSYIYIEKLGLAVDYEQGTASHKITDAWVYIDGTLIGAYELPAKVPILAEGPSKITVSPGIKINGISATRSSYPFFTSIKKEINLVRDSTYIWIDTLTSYRDNVKFAWLESFDLPLISFDTTNKSTVTLGTVSDEVLKFHLNGEQNEYSARVVLPADSSIFEATTTETFDFPPSGSEVFLEMNYKTDNQIVVGVIYFASGIRVQRPLIILNPSEQWNKVYVNMTVPKYDTPNATDFRIFLGAQTDEGKAGGSILFDNMKLVHYNTGK